MLLYEHPELIYYFFFFRRQQLEQSCGPDQRRRPQGRTGNSNAKERQWGSKVDVTICLYACPVDIADAAHGQICSSLSATFAGGMSSSQSWKCIFPQKTGRRGRRAKQS